MEKREKYTFGDNNQRKVRLYHFEKQLHQYVEVYRKEWQYSEYSILPEIDALLKRIENKEYQKNAFLLPYL